MKIFTYILMALAVMLIIYNITLLNFNNLLEGDSQTALIGILASSCVLVLLAILILSKKIQKKAS